MHPIDRFRLDGKVVVVTGASSGLGAGFARACASAGAKVVLAARREDRLHGLADELTARGAVAVPMKVDVSEPQACHAMVDSVADHLGRIDVLVNNAGVGPAGSALREDLEVFRRTIDTNLAGAYWMARACAPRMPPGSSIVNVASVLGRVASRFPQAGYSASKAGVLGLTRDLAQQWSKGRGIRVNALCPGYFESELTSGEGADKLRAMVADNSILGRFGDQEELDTALLFLASPASSYMTGAELVVDGGLTATL